jgi:hypothetical protein
MVGVAIALSQPWVIGGGGGAPKDNEDGGADGRRGRPPEDDERWSDGGLTSARFKPTDHAQPRPTFKNQ